MIYEELVAEGRAKNLKFKEGTIYIPKLTYPNIKIYDGDKKLVCTINREEELDYIRIQIKNNKLDGWFLEFEGNIYDIKSDGSIPKWSPKLFEVYHFCVHKLFGFNI